jgi:thiol-disulfide isomerase/thioredoxin
MHHRFSVAAALFLTVVVGCAAGTTDAQPPSDRSVYPPGPYDTGEGDVLGPLSFIAPDGSAFDVDAAVFADPDARVLLVNTAAGWCGACVEEQPVLQTLSDERPALSVIVALFEDADGAPADAALARDWQDRHDVAFDVVADPAFVLSAFYDPSLTPMNMVVDVDTMTIRRVGTGFDEDAVTAIIDAVLAEKGLL